MYLPTMFKEDRVERLHGFIRASALATLVTQTPAGLIASHVPMLLDASPSPYGTLIGHVARPISPADRTASSAALSPAGLAATRRRQTGRPEGRPVA